MSGLLAGLGGSILKGIGMSVGWGLVVNLGVTLIANTAANLLARKRKAQARAIVTGRAADTDPMTTLPVLYGKHRIGGTIIYAGTTASKTVYSPGTADPDGFLWLVAALCHGPVTGIDEVYLDGVEAFDANGRANDSLDPTADFLKYAAVWKAHGGAGQLAIEPMARGNKTVTASTPLPLGRRITTSAAHGYAEGDVIDFSGVVGCTAGYGYPVTAVGSSTQFDIYQVRAGIASGGGGTCDFYTPFLPTLFPADWTGVIRGGKGVAYVLIRLLKKAELFAQIPRVEAVVRGRPGRDPRSYTVKAATATAFVASYTGYSTTIDLTITAHGYAEGDVVHVTGHTQPEHNGQHRILRIVDANTIRLPVSDAGTGTASVEKLTYSTNPAVCIREYLSNGIYGAGATAAELDDPAFEDEADHHDTLVYVAVPNTASYTNRREITQIVTSGTVATVTTASAHQYATSDAVRVTGFDAQVAGALNVTGATITVTGGTTFTFASVVAAATYTPDVWDIPTGVEGEAPIPTAQGWVTAVTQTQKRYELSGIVDTREPVVRVLEDLLTSCLGSLLYEGGLFRIFTRRTTSASSFALTTDTVVGDTSVVLPGQRDLANVVRANFRNADRQYADDFVEYPVAGDPNPYQTSNDGGLVLRKTLDLPFTTNRARAQQMAALIRRESRTGTVCAVTAKEEALKLRSWDVVPVTHAASGWVAKSFWVADMKMRPDALVELTLLEYDAGAYTLEGGDDTPFEVVAALARSATLSQGGHRGFAVINELHRIKDQGKLPLLSAAGPRSYQHDGSGTVLPGLITSSGTTITIDDHVVRVGTDEDGVTQDISYTGSTCTGAAASLNYVYTDDPDQAGGAVTYVATTNNIVLAGHHGRYFVGVITTTAGAGTGAGYGGGGSSNALF